MSLPDIKRLGKNPTEDEKWTYYSEVYAWRIVRGWGKEDDRTCPIDPKGQWYNQAMVEAVVSRYRRILAAQRRAYDEHQSRDEDVQAQNEKYARGLAWRQGRLDQYDGIHHPDKLRDRQRAQAAAEPANPGMADAVSKALEDLGVSSNPVSDAAE